MQTRRDQLQAYRFQNRRALAALVTGQPNVLEPPMRRLTVTTLSGIMIAILIAVVFGILAVIHPSAGDSWKNPSAVIVDPDTNSTYIYSKGVLHPVLNYTSAVLAVSNASAVSRITVSSSDISGAKFGFEIGSAAYPNSLPSADSLADFPISSCSILRPRDTQGANARVTLNIGSRGGTRAVPSTQAVQVFTPGSSVQWLLYGGHRYQVGPGTIAANLGLNSASAFGVGTAFLDSIPEGAPLAPPTITGHGREADFALGARHPVIGSIVKTSDTADSYLVTRTQLVQLTALELALFPDARRTTATQAEVTPDVRSGNLATENPLAGFAGLPPTPPHIDPDAATRGGVCAVFHEGAPEPSFLVPSGTLKDYVAARTGQSGASRNNQADEINLPATEGLLATPAGTGGPALIVSTQGIKYSFADPKLLTAFGYQASDEVQVPAQLLTMIPGQRIGLSRSTALGRPGH